MSVAERFMYTNPDKAFPYQPWASYRINDTDVVGFPVSGSSCETTTTAPPRIPVAVVDCFDANYPETQSTLRMPSTVFLQFEEFQGFAPLAPLLVRVEFGDDLCEIEHTELGVYGRGASCGEALVDFLEYLISDYKAYAEEPEENLDSQARALAAQYRGILRKI